MELAPTCVRWRLSSCRQPALSPDQLFPSLLKITWDEYVCPAQETCSALELENTWILALVQQHQFSRQVNSACRRREEAPTISQFSCCALPQGQMFGKWGRIGKILVLPTLVWFLTCLNFHTSFFTVRRLTIDSYVLLLVCFLYSADQELNVCIKLWFSEQVGTRTPGDGCSGPWWIIPRDVQSVHLIDVHLLAVKEFLQYLQINSLSTSSLSTQ